MHMCIYRYIQHINIYVYIYIYILKLLHREIVQLARPELCSRMVTEPTAITTCWHHLVPHLPAITFTIDVLALGVR